MRTTINLPDPLLAAAKKAAAETSRTLGAVIEDALREALSRRRHPGGGRPELPIFRGTGLLPGVDLADSAALLDLIERDDGPR